MKRITQERELNEINAGKRTVVLFHATWCPFCVRYKATFEQETAGLTGQDVVEAVIDDESNPLWTRYNIQVVPSVLFFEDGKVVKRLDGLLGRGLKAGQVAEALKST